MILRPLDREALRQQYLQASPFAFVKLEQFWDRDVKYCRKAFAPAFNRCVIFQTSDISFHGVTPVTTSAPFPRLSFAAYYYTYQAPPNWKGTIHSTIFKARPEERFRGYVLMPAALLHHRLVTRVRSI